VERDANQEQLEATLYGRITETENLEAKDNETEQMYANLHGRITDLEEIVDARNSDRKQVQDTVAKYRKWRGSAKS